MQLSDFDFHHLEPYISRARQAEPARVAVAGGADEKILQTVCVAMREGVAQVMLFGDSDRIRMGLEGMDAPDDQYQILHCDTRAGAARQAARSCGSGEADILMKGFVSTGEFLRAVLNEETGLRSGRILSHMGLFDLPLYSRMIGMTDGGINIDPDFETRVEIVRNAAELGRSVWQRPPRIALVAAVENVQQNMPVTLQWAAISKMAQRGEFGEAVVDGPLGLDNALVPEAAEQKGIDTPVEGKADIVVVPDIQAGNLMGKAMTYLAGAPMAGLVVGARAPVVLNSRVDSPAARLASLLVALAIACR